MNCFCRVSPVESYICPQSRWFIANFGKRKSELDKDRLTKFFGPFIEAMQRGQR
jgi:hypothetical protein